MLVAVEPRWEAMMSNRGRGDTFAAEAMTCRWTQAESPVGGVFKIICVCA